MKIFFQTRSKFHDYRFVGGQPEDSWWFKYRDFVVFEKPGFLLNSTEKEFKLYIWRIPTGRKDRVGTEIFSSFLFQSLKTGIDSQRQTLAITFLKKFITSTLKNDFKELENRLLQYFPEDLIEDNWFKLTEKNEQCQSEVSEDFFAKQNISLIAEVDDSGSKFLESFCASQANQISSGSKFTQNYWICGVKNPDLTEDQLFSIFNNIPFTNEKVLYGYFNAVFSEKGKEKLMSQFSGEDFQRLGLIINSDSPVEGFEIARKNQQPDGKNGSGQKKTMGAGEKIRLGAKILLVLSLIASVILFLVIVMARMTSRPEPNGGAEEVSTVASSPKRVDQPQIGNGNKSKPEEPDTVTSKKGSENETSSSGKPFLDSDLIWVLGKTKDFLIWFIQSLGWPLIKKIFTALYSQF